MLLTANDLADRPISPPQFGECQTKAIDLTLSDQKILLAESTEILLLSEPFVLKFNLLEASLSVFRSLLLVFFD